MPDDDRCGTLKVEIRCGRAFRGNAVATLRMLLAETPGQSPRREVYERLLQAIAEAPWHYGLAPARAADMHRADGLGADPRTGKQVVS